jgi:hypothetical protein
MIATTDPTAAHRIFRVWLAVFTVSGGTAYSFLIATQSISMSKGPVHCGTQKKMRAGGFFGK